MSTSDILESLIEKDNGYLITSKAIESGVSKPSVSKYVREHDMEKVAHGIYILDDVWPDELFVLQQRNKNIIYSGETALYLHVLSTENTVIFVSLFLPGIMLHISKRKTKKFVMQTQRFLIWGPVKSRQAAVIWLKYMTRKDVFVI
mgnify:FL=1